MRYVLERGVAGSCRMFTARVITRPTVTSETSDCSPMVIFAAGESASHVAESRRR
jgi:hypothetical protein